MSPNALKYTPSVCGTRSSFGSSPSRNASSRARAPSSRRGAAAGVEHGSNALRYGDVQVIFQHTPSGERRFPPALQEQRKPINIGTNAGFAAALQEGVCTKAPEFHSRVCTTVDAMSRLRTPRARGAPGAPPGPGPAAPRAARAGPCAAPGAPARAARLPVWQDWRRWPHLALPHD